MYISFNLSPEHGPFRRLTNLVSEYCTDIFLTTEVLFWLTSSVHIEKVRNPCPAVIPTKRIWQIYNEVNKSSVISSPSWVLGTVITEYWANFSPPPSPPTPPQSSKIHAFFGHLNIYNGWMADAASYCSSWEPPAFMCTWLKCLAFDKIILFIIFIYLVYIIV